MREVVYARSHYVLIKKRYGYIVINTKKPFKEGHTHVRDLYVGRVIIDNVRKEILPKSRSENTIISPIRVSSSKEYTKRLEEYLEKVRKENTL